MSTPQQLSQSLTTNPSLAVIDVRTPAEFETVHLEGSINCPLDSLKLPADLDKSTPIYLICQGGTRATRAHQTLASQGYQNAIVLQGGLQAWLQEGLPVVRGPNQVISLERQVRIGAGTLVLSGVLLGYFVNSGFYYLSGFVGAGLIFAGITDWCGMALVLAKFPWNQSKPK